MRKNNYKGFTLIELLVVIAIISLLVSILLPSLRQATLLAKRIRCAANQHALGLSFHMYAQENQGSFPFQNVYVVWHFVQNRNSINPDNHSWAGSLWEYSNSIELYSCPEAQHDDAQYSEDENTSYFGNGMVFGNNISLDCFQDLTGTALLQEWTWKKWYAMLQPRYDTMEADIWNWNSSAHGGIHDDGGNMLWADGHVTYVLHDDKDYSMFTVEKD